MFFRNLTMFRFPTSLHLADLPHALPECAAKPVGPLELSSRGFVPPMGQHHEGFSHHIGNAIWITFAFGEDMVVRKLKLLDGVVEALDSAEHEDVRAELDARFALLTGEIGHLFDVLERAFKLSKADA